MDQFPKLLENTLDTPLNNRIITPRCLKYSGNNRAVNTEERAGQLANFLIISGLAREGKSIRKINKPHSEQNIVLRGNLTLALAPEEMKEKDVRQFPKIPLTIEVNAVQYKPSSE